jgi:hypothetical protein
VFGEPVNRDGDSIDLTVHALDVRVSVLEIPMREGT